MDLLFIIPLMGIGSGKNNLIDFLYKTCYIEFMIITKEGKYKSKSDKVFDVVNVSPEGCRPYFRAYWNGGYYNVNVESDNFPFDKVEMEMVEYVGPLDKD
jgi:hypothetical protein